MLTSLDQYVAQQREICRRWRAPFTEISGESKLGYAMSTEHKIPMNGLRHKPDGSTNGWYVWFGEELSGAPDFFVPLHAYHLKERCPEIIKYLALPPGYRFLVAKDHEDVWYDASLL